MRDAQLRREFLRICTKMGINMHVDINGNFYGSPLGFQAFDLFKAGMEYGYDEINEGIDADGFPYGDL